MAHRSYRDQSRSDWGVSDDAAPMTLERIQTGALLRIADALERMAKPYVDLLQERDTAQRAHRACLIRTDKEMAVLRGKVTKLRNKLAARDDGAAPK